ncbi:hypothetical protein PUN28_011215 [Cardiocondyla obscurior]|uniref:Uncharacterized protein n=1 Tax=Cardiocondyla obscurior TaxID=286306 RepID=A0AAW2FQT3_9HYME
MKLSFHTGSSTSSCTYGSSVGSSFSFQNFLCLSVARSFRASQISIFILPENMVNILTTTTGGKSRPRDFTLHLLALKPSPCLFFSFLAVSLPPPPPPPPPSPPPSSSSPLCRVLSYAYATTSASTSLSSFPPLPPP